MIWDLIIFIRHTLIPAARCDFPRAANLVPADPQKAINSLVSEGEELHLTAINNTSTGGRTGYVAPMHSKFQIHPPKKTTTTFVVVGGIVVEAEKGEGARALVPPPLELAWK